METEQQTTDERREAALALEAGLNAGRELEEELEQEEQEPQGDDEPNAGAMEAAYKVAIAMALSASLTSAPRPAGFQTRRGWRNATARKRALEEIRDRIERLQSAGVPVDMRVFELDTVALALHFASLRILVLEGRAETTLAAVLREMSMHRRALLLLLQAAVLTGGVNAQHVQNILKGTGPTDFANDVFAALDLMQRYPELFRGSPLLPDAFVARARELAHESLARLRVPGLPSDPARIAEELKKAREERRLLLALLMDLDAEADRLLVFFHGKAEAARRAPSLQQGRRAASLSSAGEAPQPETEKQSA